MRINISFKDFKKTHSKRKHQVLFRTVTCKNYYKVENLYKFLLAEKNSFIFESVEKGIIRGRYTIIGLNPDKIWDINSNVVTLSTSEKRIKIKTDPLKYLNKLIKDFKIAVVDVKDAQHIIDQIKGSRVKIFKGDLIQFKSWLTNQKCLISPDSMAAHLAAYLKIPVVTLFGSQDPKLTSPIAENSLVVTPETICSHKREHWRLCSECMNSITPDKVYQGVCNLMNEANI